MRVLTRHAALAAVVLLLATSLAGAQNCGNIDAKAAGAGAGGNDASILKEMDETAQIGIIYLPGNTVYKVQSSLTLNTPVMAEEGAVIEVADGVTLTLNQQPEHPLSRFFSGGGSVVFGEGAVRVYPEWFGANPGDAGADSSGAIQKAYDAAAEKGNAMLYLTGTYGVGSELVFGANNRKATIMAEPSARFVSQGGNGKGVTFPAGGFAFKNVLPHLQGFGEFCFRLQGTDLGAFQLQTLSGCGDAIRLQAAAGDNSNLLDNTIWYNKIENSVNAIAIRAATSCVGATCVLQGNHIVGNEVVGGAGAGDTRTIGFFCDGACPSSVPAWDSNQINIGTVTPPTSNPKYAFMHADGKAGDPNFVSNRMVIKVATFGAMGPGGRMFSGTHNMLQATINLGSPLAEGALNLYGQLNLVEFGGATTPRAGTPPIVASTASNTKASFNSGKALVGNYFSLIAKPDKDWAPGEILQFFVYHQLATGALYQIKCNAPKGTGGLSIVACTQAQDNSQVPKQLGGSMVPYEVGLWLINMSGATIRKGSNVPFGLAIATLGAAP